MKGFIYWIAIIVLVIVSSPPGTARASNHLQACDTAECKEYFTAYRILTRRGHSEAMATLGELYYAGYGTEKNTEQALKWFRRAAKYGITSAQYKAGVLYLQDSDFQDVEKGVSLIKKATKYDFSPACFVLGKIYLDGRFIPQDISQADKWLSAAYKLNNHETIKFANRLKNSAKTASLELTELFSLIESDIKVPSAPGSNPPINEMETIVITAPEYTEYFDAEIARLNKSIPDTSSGTGSKIAGRTCSKLWGCSTESDRERIRDVLLNDWGLETIRWRP